MYKVTKRDCPMFGIGPYVCEFICDTASDISTLPTSISEGTGGRTAYDNQKCASGSIANVAENGAESKQYMLNNQDIWCPYSVAVGNSGGGSGESSITVDFVLSETSENPVANKVIAAALDEKANASDIPDLTPYAKKTDVPNIKVNAAVGADNVGGVVPSALFCHRNIPSSRDLNECVELGSYFFNGINANAPTSNGAVASGTYIILDNMINLGYIKQSCLFVHGSAAYLGRMFVRYYDKMLDSWSEWKENYTEAGKPYITGDTPVAANSSVCVTKHGFTPSAVIWWDGSSSGVAVSFNETQFVMNSEQTTDRTVNYLIFK